MTRPRRASAPLVTLALLAAMFFVFAAELAGDGMRLCQAHGFVPSRPTALAMLSYPFVHDPSTWTHVGGNAVFLLVFGSLVERELGHLRLAALFLASGVAGALMHALVAPGATSPLVGMSGCLFGLMAVGAVLRPRLLGFVAIYTATQIGLVLTSAGSDVSYGCHLGGFVFGAFAVLAARLPFVRAVPA